MLISEKKIGFFGHLLENILLTSTQIWEPPPNLPEGRLSIFPLGG